jgi:hypothetical protein
MTFPLHADLIASRCGELDRQQRGAYGVRVECGFNTRSVAENSGYMGGSCGDGQSDGDELGESAGELIGLADGSGRPIWIAFVGRWD